MKYLNSEYYVEVKDQRYRIHSIENIKLRKRDPPISLRLNMKFKMKHRLGRIRK